MLWFGVLHHKEQRCQQVEDGAAHCSHNVLARLKSTEGICPSPAIVNQSTAPNKTEILFAYALLVID